MVLLLIILIKALEVLKWLVIIRALMSWFVDPYSDNPFVRLVRRITDPVLRPLSQMIPPLGGVDLSPILAFVVIYLFQYLFQLMIFRVA